MKFFEVFKAGNYPQRIFSQDDVNALAQNYDPKFCEAPITLDHEQKGPAYGWVSQLKSENGKLKASFRDVADELKDFVQSGKYKKISVEIYKELEGKKPYLNAVSFLGACIPQVKGMEPVEFKDGESEIYIFEIEEKPEVKIEIKSKNKATEPYEEAPEIKTTEELVKLQNQISELESQIVLFIDQPNISKNNDLVTKLQEKVEKMSVHILTMQDESVARQKAEQELNKLKLQIKINEFEQFLNQQLSSGNLTPVQKDMSLKIFKALDNVKKFDESDYIEEFKQFIKTFPKQVEFDEIATKKKQEKPLEENTVFSYASEDSLSIYQEAKQIAERDNISFKDALLKLYD